MIDLTKRPLLLYDHQCTFCQRFAHGIKHLDKNDLVTLVSIHEEELYQSFDFLNQDDCHDTVHLIDEQNQIHKGPEVIHYLLGIIPSCQKLAWLLDNKAGQKAVSFFYNKVNEIRKLGLIKCPNCNNKER